MTLIEPLAGRNMQMTPAFPPAWIYPSPRFNCRLIYVTFSLFLFFFLSFFLSFIYLLACIYIDILLGRLIVARSEIKIQGNGWKQEKGREEKKNGGEWDLELMRSRHLETSVSQLSVKASISIRSWIHCSLLAGVNKPTRNNQSINSYSIWNHVSIDKLMDGSSVAAWAIGSVLMAWMCYLRRCCGIGCRSLWWRGSGRPICASSRLRRGRRWPGTNWRWWPLRGSRPSGNCNCWKPNHHQESVSKKFSISLFLYFFISLFKKEKKMGKNNYNQW